MRRLVALVVVVAAMMALTVAPAFASSDDFSVCLNGDTISGLTHAQARDIVDNTSADWGACNNNNNGGAFNFPSINWTAGMGVF